MATRKSNSGPRLAAVAPAQAQFENPQSLQDLSPFIGSGPEDTMSVCASVLAFLGDHHMRRPVNGPDGEVEDGEYYVLLAVKEALNKQASALETAKSAEASNG